MGRGTTEDVHLPGQVGHGLSITVGRGTTEGVHLPGQVGHGLFATVGSGTTEGVHLPAQVVSSSCCLLQESGLSLWIREQLKVFTDLDRWCHHPVVVCYRSQVCHCG